MVKEGPNEVLLRGIELPLVLHVALALWAGFVFKMVSSQAMITQKFKTQLKAFGFCPPQFTSAQTNLAIRHFFKVPPWGVRVGGSLRPLPRPWRGDASQVSSLEGHCTPNDGFSARANRLK